MNDHWTYDERENDEGHTVIYRYKPYGFRFQLQTGDDFTGWNDLGIFKDQKDVKKEIDMRHE